jgi:hypothetical protein
MNRRAILPAALQYRGDAGEDIDLEGESAMLLAAQSCPDTEL